MSDISINISFSNNASKRKRVTQNLKKKKKFHNKQQFLQEKGNLESQQTNTDSGKFSNDQTSLFNGASQKQRPLNPFKQNKSLFRPATTTSASQSYSRTSESSCTLPSWAFSRKSESSIGKPGNTKSTTTTTTPEVNKSLPHPNSSVSASPCSSGPSASMCTLPSWAFTVKSESNQNKPKEPAKKKSASSNFGNSSPSESSSHKSAPTKYVALDCEMVGTGPKGSISQLARCSIVSYEGDVVYDKFINPPVPVTDYRTRWSGIRRSDLIRATPYAQARKEILKLLMGKVVVGHAVHNDFKVLSYTHPAALTRDTSRIPLLNLKAGFAEKDCASLKRLTKAIFNRDIQAGKSGHSSVEDARATMELYRVVEEEWERRLASKQQSTK